MIVFYLSTNNFYGALAFWKGLSFHFLDSDKLKTLSPDPGRRLGCNPATSSWGLYVKSDVPLLTAALTHRDNAWIVSFFIELGWPSI